MKQKIQLSETLDRNQDPHHLSIDFTAYKPLNQGHAQPLCSLSAPIKLGCVVVQTLSHGQFFCNPMDCSLPGSSIHGILQARILELVAVSPGNLPTQGSIPCLLYWQVGSFPLSHQGSHKTGTDIQIRATQYCHMCLGQTMTSLNGKFKILQSRSRKLKCLQLLGR